MKYKRIVSIGAHSLDAELMGGPLMIQQASQGAKCTFVHVTSGRLEDPQATQEEKEKYIQNILNENKNAARELGGDCWAMRYSSSELPEVSAFVQKLEAYFKDEQVDLVITHWRGTLHDRHYYVYDAVTKAVRSLRSQGVKIDLLYGENCEDLVGFTPTLYYSISQKAMDQWFKGLSEYQLFKGDVNDVPYQEFYRCMSKVRAIEAGCKNLVKSYMHAALIEDDQC